jgi:hypothetical protein
MFLLLSIRLLSSKLLLPLPLPSTINLSLTVPLLLLPRQHIPRDLLQRVPGGALGQLTERGDGEGGVFLGEGVGAGGAGGGEDEAFCLSEGEQGRKRKGGEEEGGRVRCRGICRRRAEGRRMEEAKSRESVTVGEEGKDEEKRTSSTSPSSENFRSINSPSCGNSSHAYSAGAVANPSLRSAPPPGLPSSAADAVKSSMSSMSCEDER